METIKETLLTESLKNKAVKQVEIRQTEKGKWQVWVQLTWREGECNLITARGNSREWANLDRLISHFQENQSGPFPPIALTLNQQKPDRN